MAVLNIKHSSKILQKESRITIIGNLDADNLRDLKIMYFLHGLGSDNNTILEKTNILQHALANDFIIIFPNADRSFYTNTGYGANYYDYIANEVPNFISKNFKFNLNQDNCYIAGISMGGYGALKVFLNTNFFSKCITFSGSLDIVTRDKQKREIDGKIKQEWESIFGENITKENDLFFLSANRRNTYKEVELYIGDQDYLLEGNIKLNDHLESLSFYTEFIKVSGKHDYPTFSKEIDLFFQTHK